MQSAIANDHGREFTHGAQGRLSDPADRLRAVVARKNVVANANILDRDLHAG
jgi:hypothetical protein